MTGVHTGAWAYEVQQLPESTGVGQINETLSDRGKQGWEAFAVEHQKGFWFLFFKKPLEPGRA